MRTALALLLVYDSPLLTLEQLAALMGLDARSLQNKVYANECPFPVFKVGTKWHATVNDVAAYIDTQRNEAAKMLGLPPFGAA